MASATKEDHIVRLWDVATGQERLRLTGNERPVSCLAFTPDGKAVISAAGEQDKDGTIRKWDTATGKSLGTVRIPKAGEQNLDTSWPLAISPDCRSLAVDCWGGIPIKMNGRDGRRYPGYKIRLLDLMTGKERCLLRGQEVPIDSVAFSPDSKLIALTDLNSKVVVCDVFSGRQRWEIQAYPSKFRGTQFFNLAFSPDGKTLASAESLNAIHFWDVSTGRELRANSATHHSDISRVAYSPDGKMLATGSSDQTVSLWDAITGKHLFKLRGHEGRISGLAFSPDSKMLAAFGNWHFVYLYDTATGKEIQKFPVPDPQNGEKLVGGPVEPMEPLSLAFTSDASYLVGVGIDKKLRRWEVATGKRFPPRLLQLSGMEGPPDFNKTIWATQLSPNAKTAALATPEGVYLVDVRSGKELFKLKAPLFIVPMGALAFSADGRIVASGASNNEFLLWEVATGREITKIFRSGNTYSIAFPPQGRSIAAGIGSNQGLIHVVDTVTGKDLWKIKGDSSFVGALTFSPDGKRLASGQRDSTVLIWDATAAKDQSKLAEKDLSPKHLERLWTDLAGADAFKAYAAIWTLASAPDETVNFMKDKLPPVPKVKPERLRRIIAELDHEKFAVREEATKELTRLGIEAEPALRQALAGTKALEIRRRIEAILASPASPKVDSPDRLRRLRAVQVLEQIGTPPAEGILQGLADGAPGAWETQEAQAALERLSKRQKL